MKRQFILLKNHKFFSNSLKKVGDGKEDNKTGADRRGQGESPSYFLNIWMELEALYCSPAPNTLYYAGKIWMFKIR